MKHLHLINQIDDGRVLEAIHEVETKSTAYVRVMVSKRAYRDALVAAERHFKVLRLERHPDRNIVLIFIAPKSRNFAIYADTAAHTRCGPDFFNALRDEMAQHMKESRFTDALVHTIQKAGEQLAVYFPPKHAP